MKLMNLINVEFEVNNVECNECEIEIGDEYIEFNERRIEICDEW